MKALMPRCPLCASARFTILISLYPHAFCSGCGTRWIQDGREQRAVKNGRKRRHAPRRRAGRGPVSRPPPATTPPRAGFYRTSARPGSSQP
jgi:hypothetical protein